MRRFCTTALLLLWSLCAFAVQKSGTIVSINGAKYYVHTVQPTETLYALSKEYGVAEKVIVEHNPAAATGLKAGENIKIPVIVPKVAEQKSDKKLRKTFSNYDVVKGDNLYAIARKFQVPINTVIEDNPGLDPTQLKAGDRILIRKTEIGSESEAENKAQWEKYRSSLNSVAEAGDLYHMVHAGETFYSLSRRFGISEEELSALNNGLKAADLKVGAILKVPGGIEQVAAQPNVDSATRIIPKQPEAAKSIRLHTLRRGEKIHAALLLPVSIEGSANANYLEFYQGFLLGLDSMKRQYGISTDVSLYNTGRNPEKIREIVESSDFRKTNLIIGPVYEEGLYPVVQFAEHNHIPVVSPLANITKTNSSALFQMAPDPTHKYAKVAELLGSDKHITLIYSGSTDKEFEQEILAQLQHTPYSTHNYQFVHPSAGASKASDLSPLLDNGEDNVFIIMADNEVDVDRILAAIASSDTNLTARGRTTPRFKVLGNARWNRYNTIDRERFFKDRVVFVSNYHAKRDAQVIADFDKAYLRAFGSLPTLYSYRGYDAAVLFCPAMFDDIEQNMEGVTYTPLQTTYIFGPSANGNHVNQNWMRVNYHPDFTITIE